MARTTIRSEDITAGQVKAADLASDAVDTTGIQTDIAILGFKVAANGSLSKYNLVDQTIDVFEDATGIDTSGSTDEVRNASNYYSGINVIPAATTAFTTVESTTWTAPAGVTSVYYLVVAGGGAGGGGKGRDHGGGGGGAGGLLTGTHTVVPTNSYTVTVGAGGIGINTAAPGPNGGNSVFDSLTSIGGGGGGFGPWNQYNPGSGGSGGGVGGGGGTAGTGTSGQGNNGSGSSSQYNGAGGGGKGGGGGGASASKAGNGGAGYDATTVFGTTYGVSGFFAGGGGAGWNNYNGGNDESGDGGSGGGGGGGQSFNAVGRAATANTGGGGGGGSSGGNESYTWYRYGGNGGSGVVLIKYDAVNLYNDMTLVSNATTAEAVPTKGDLVMTYSDGVGTATINTDIKGWVSRDDGTTYTQFTLADDGDTGGHTILTAHDLDISGQPSGTSMRYKITTHNQSASKETRIQAVSLGWS